MLVSLCANRRAMPLFCRRTGGDGLGADFWCCAPCRRVSWLRWRGIEGRGLCHPNSTFGEGSSASLYVSFFMLAVPVLFHRARIPI